MAPPAKKPFRILCLGDSLTEGYPFNHPYASRLEAKLEAAFPSLDVRCEVDGVAGDQVAHGSFLERMKDCWAREKYDWTIVLGGTNDIGWGYAADITLEALEEVWNIPLSRGGKVLALTVPECAVQGSKLIHRRNELNKGIRSYQHENYYTFNLHKSLPYFDMDPGDRERYWNFDGLHLTEAGYDLMGEKIADALTKILGLQEAQTTEISSVIADARQRRLIEDMIFEEELDNPHDLSHGWIVVRKRDLD